MRALSSIKTSSCYNSLFCIQNTNITIILIIRFTRLMITSIDVKVEKCFSISILHYTLFHLVAYMKWLYPKMIRKDRVHPQD